MAAAVLVGSAGGAAAQSRSPDYSLIDPAWAAGQLDTTLQNGAGAPAWRALKRDYPQDYQAFLKTYVAAILHHQERASISGAFIQDHLKLAMAVAPRAPPSALARVQKAKAAAIEQLSTRDIAACAAFASGDQGAMARSVDHMDDRTLTLMAQIDGAMFDAAAAAVAEPHARAALDAGDIATVKKLAIEHGGTAAQADAIFSAPPQDEDQRCRLGVLFYDAIAAAPDETAAKFVFR